LLADRLVCLWTQSIESGIGKYHHTVLPDGCVDIVWIGSVAPVVAGPATRHTIVELATGTTLIGARFRPGWAASCLGLPMDQLLDKDVPLAELWGARAESLSEKILETDSTLAQLRALGAELTVQLSTAKVAHRSLQAAVTWLARYPVGRVHDLARFLGLSERQLHRHFRNAVGYGPKTFQRIMRLQRMLTASTNVLESSFGLANLAADAGYADQAHMSREVRALTGAPPRSLLRRHSSSMSMSDLFKNVDRANAILRISNSEHTYEKEQ
jgi:AraC-like DNA-binding protein